MADVEDFGVVLGVIGDPESIPDMAVLTRKWRYLYSWWADLDSFWVDYLVRLNTTTGVKMSPPSKKITHKTNPKRIYAK